MHFCNSPKIQPLYLFTILILWTCPLGWQLMCQNVKQSRPWSNCLSSLIRVYTVCSGMSVQTFMIKEGKYDFLLMLKSYRLWTEYTGIMAVPRNEVKKNGYDDDDDDDDYRQSKGIDNCDDDKREETRWWECWQWQWSYW